MAELVVKVILLQTFYRKKFRKLLCIHLYKIEDYLLSTGDIFALIRRTLSPLLDYLKTFFVTTKFSHMGYDNYNVL